MTFNFAKDSKQLLKNFHEKLAQIATKQIKNQVIKFIIRNLELKELITSTPHN